MENSINKEKLSKEILNSNLSDEAKIELFRIIFKETVQVITYPGEYVTTHPDVTYPPITRDPITYWQVTCKN